ncbi:MAG: hypothetical protein OSA99_20910 [Acidimicrobiales bacterium]|nr:hypothetical protein [Acidimicrobiales bacterium]
MFRGQLHLDRIDDDRAVVALTSERVTTWDGFHAETVDVSMPVPA